MLNLESLTEAAHIYAKRVPAETRVLNINLDPLGHAYPEVEFLVAGLDEAKALAAVWFLDCATRKVIAGGTDVLWRWSAAVEFGDGESPINLSVVAVTTGS